MAQGRTHIQTEDDGVQNGDNISFSSTVPDHPDLIEPKESRWKQALRNVTIEPVLFFHMFGYFSLGIIVQNLFIQRICTVSFGYTPQQCQNISNEVGEDDRHKIDALASELFLYRGLIETIIPIMFSFFLGSWTDKHGSKFSLLLPVFGCLLSAAFLTLIAFLPNVYPEYILFCSIPISLTGGTVAIALSAFSFISALTTNENRSFRIIVLESAKFAGMLPAIIVGAKIYSLLGFAGVFINSFVFFSLALLYGLVFVHEKKPEISSETSNYFKDMFNVQAVKDTFWAVFRKRDGSRRLWIILLIVTNCMRTLTQSGPGNVTYLFVRHQFGWTEQEFSTLSTVDMVLALVGGGTVTFLFVQRLQLSDSLVGLLCCSGYVFGSIIVAAAPQGPLYGWMMYAANCAQMFGGMTTVIIRSMVSKIAPQQELGRIFTFVASGEAGVPLIATPLYTLIFIASESSFPGAFSLLSAGVNLLVMCSFVYFFIYTRRNPDILQLEEEADEASD